MYAQGVVIQQGLQKRMLKEFHVGHPGISRMQALMQGFVYWPSVDKEVENPVKSCRRCALTAKQPMRSER